MLLVNGQTRGSAEALAGALRAQDRGIVVGSKTAGSAAAWQDVKLADGRTLRLATAKIVLPPSTAGGQPVDLFPNGITPDVAVKIDTQKEYDVVFAPATNETLTVSLQPRVKKKDLTEAQLVKAFHGQSVDVDEPSTNKPSLHIPVPGVRLRMGTNRRPTSSMKRKAKSKTCGTWCCNGRWTF